MALGQMVGIITEVPAGGFLDIRPSAGVEYVIHNIAVPDGTMFELYYSDGVNNIKVDSGAASIVDVHYHASNSIYYRVKNTSSSSAAIGYDGVIIYEG